MYKMIAVLVLLSGLIQAQDSLQSDLNQIDVYVIPEIPDQDEYAQKIELTPLDFTMSLAEKIRSESSVNIKAYGVEGSLSSLSLRGTSSSHTNYSWNGFNMNSISLGSFNYGREGNLFQDELTINQNPNGSVSGSGAIGGVVSTKSNPIFKNKTKLTWSQATGKYDFRSSDLDEYSLNTYSTLALTNSSDRLFFRIGASIVDAPNVFVSDSIELHQDESFRNEVFKSDLYYKINSSETIGFNYWGSLSDKALEPSSTNAFQQDSSHRFILSWKKELNNGGLQLAVSRFNELTHYSAYHNTTNDLMIDSRSLTNSSNVKFTFDRSVGKKSTINLGSVFNHNRAEVFAYDGIIQQNISGTYLQFAFKEWKYLELIPSIRYDAFDDYDNKVLSSIAISTTKEKSLWFSFNSGEKYRIPTFNDRFWNPGGNPDLEAEKGLSSGANLHYTFKKKGLTIEPNLSVFRIKLDNWIQWVPNGSYWQPVSYMSVLSEGFEWRTKMSYADHNWKLSWDFNYNYVETTIDEVIEGNEHLLGNQLIYTPKHRVNQSFRFYFKNWNFNYQTDFTSLVHTTYDNEEVWALDPVLLHHIGCSYLASNNWFDHTIFIRVQNILNKDYESVRGYATPGRYIKTGIILQIKYQ